MKKLVTFIVVLLLVQGYGFAQSNRVTGKVTGSDNQALPGVNVLVSGTSLGTATDAAGNYSINVPANASLVFSYISFVSQTVPVNNGSIINVQLVEDSQAINEVIVTALGIRREAKTLGYATATINAEQITTNRTPNFVSGLQGKLAGVNITTMGTGPAGTAKIRIRGQSSFSGQNNPLIVVNGVPIDNSNYALGGDFGSRAANSSDGGDGLSSINPDDIETMTVLKGATAAALYGSRAKDGVVMITTKSRGSGKGFSVTYNTNFTTDTPLDFTDFQYEYGQGEGGIRPTTTKPQSGVWSFGEKFEPGMTQTLFDNKTYPYEPVYNRVKQFYRVGTNFTNTVTVANNGENGGFSLSLGNTDNKGIMENNTFNRKVINLGFTQNITSKLVATGNINYSKENNINPPQLNTQDFSVSTVIFTLANSMPFEALRDNQTSTNGDEFSFSRFLVRNNPYYSMNRHFENITRDRLFGNIALKYQFTDWLYVQGRLAQDSYVRNQDYNIPNGYAPIPRAPVGFVNGSFTQDVRQNVERNLDLILGANRTFGKIGVDITLGGNQRYARNDYNSVTVQDFVQPGLYTVANGRIKNPIYALSEKKINSVFGAATISYREYLYLNVTARNDWFSTLAPQNRSILYPSATGSFVFSQAFASKLPAWVSFGKLRAAYAQVGSDNVNPYSNALYYGVDNNSFPNPSGALVPVGGINASVVPNKNLRPLRIQEAEVGMELKLFQNRIGLDVTYYTKTTDDQILAAQISDASSYTSKLINVGRSMNRGLEMLLTFSPVNTNSFRWDVSANASYNTSEVLRLGLSENDTVITVGGGGGRTLNQVVGKPIGQLYTFAYLRDARGRQVFGANGFPLRNNTLKNVGNALPRYFGGITNTFTYRGLSLSALIDFKLGFNMISGRNINYVRHGLSKRTLPGRAEGYVIGDGVNAKGEINQVRALVQPYYESINPLGVNEDFVNNAGFWKLRQLSLGYDFSKLLPPGFFVKGLKLNAVANNVLIIKKWTENMDPEEALVSSDNAVGLDFWPGLPPTRSIGFNLNARF